MEDLSTFRHPTLFLSSTDADTQNLEMLPTLPCSPDGQGILTYLGFVGAHAVPFQVGFEVSS